MNLSEAEKESGLKRIAEGFEDIESLLATLKRDIKSEEEQVQLSAVFISVEMIKMVSKFVEQVQRLSDMKTPVALPKSNIFIPKSRR